jgi:hypothetical protein
LMPLRCVDLRMVVTADHRRNSLICCGTLDSPGG